MNAAPPASRFIVIAAVLCLAALPVSAEQLYVKWLKFAGVRELSKSEIRKVINTNAPSFFSFLPFVRHPPFDRAILNDDMGRIVNLYQSYGYYHADARYTLASDAAGKTVGITIVVAEGAPTRVNDVRIDIASDEEAAVRPGLAAAAVQLRRGLVFRIELYDHTKELMERYLANNGYGSARLDGRITVDKEHYLADIAFTVTTGPLQSFGPVMLEGNTHVRNEDVFREVTVREGARFSRDRLSVTQRRIFRLGLFNSVVVTPETGAGRVVPVHIRVEERERRTLSLGLGYGNEDKIRTQATWTRRYLWGRPRTLRADLRHSDILLIASLDLTQQYFIDRLSSLGIHGEYDREYYVSYSNERIVSQARVGRTINRQVEGFCTYNLEINRPVSVTQTTLQALTETHPGDYYFISSIMAGLRYDTVKENLDPVSGSMLSLFAEPATFLLGSKVDYLRVIGEGRLFLPVAGKNVAAARLRIGRIEPLRFTRNIPIFKRFFSGGSNSVRGYAYQSLGPKDFAGNPIGGDYLVEGSAELRCPVYGQFKGVIFLDGGNVYLDSSEFTVESLKYSTGIGARYATVVGPVRLDIAFPLDPFPELDLGRYTVYLSLGNAF